DSTEYAIAAYHFATAGQYSIKIDGQQLPPRYPPWFSVLLLAPVYLITGGGIGTGIFAVTVMGILGILAATYLGRQVAGAVGGILSATSVVSLSLYREYSAHIMTDVPCAALIPVTCALFLHVRRSRSNRLNVYLLAGFLAAVCASLRPVSGAVILPFLYHTSQLRPFRSTITKTVCLLFPLFALSVASMLYNLQVFGSPFRSGYNYWCAVPYDYPNLVFSIRYLSANSAAFLASGAPALILVATVLFLLCKKRKNEERRVALQAAGDIALFGILSSGPIILFHSAYFFPDARFFLPVLCITAVLCGSLLAVVLPHISRSALLVAEMLLLVIAIAVRCAMPEHLPIQRIAADNICSYTPNDALIISSINPVYLEFMVGTGTNRKVIPFSRSVEYASKLLVSERIAHPHPLPSHWSDHRCRGLIKSGAKEVIPFVATENMEAIAAAVRNGQSVYLNTSRMAASDYDSALRLKNMFNLEQQSMHLYKLGPMYK
ncbi:MAG: glycosyltransferase family 39 protein, partial [Lentisphaerae bacterium]|nr:glycosyltransferase family 39 protein [Lentisphaerota bacterium]